MHRRCRRRYSTVPAKESWLSGEVVTRICIMIRYAQIIVKKGVQFGVEKVVERTARERRASAICKLLLRPVLQSRLFVVEEDTAILDGRATV